MAKNDILLIDGIIEERKKLNIPSADNGEVFEFFSAEQILKDYDLSFEEIKNGSVDGENDGGIDYWYTFINGHLIEESYEAFPRVNASMEVYIISCKHHNTFKQSVLDIMFPTLVEIFDLSITKEEMRGQYNNELLDKRKLFIKTYKKVASALINFKIHVIYASRGDENLLEENIKSRARQLESCIAHNFSDCICGVDFYGRSQLLKLYRKQRKSLLVLPYTEILTNGCNHIAITKIEDYYSFIKDEDGKLRRYLFDSNVRAYMGLNRVNNDIMETLQNQESPNFWLLNNGVTILATKASIIGKEIEIENVQIVNGLQTSETIYNYFSNFGKDEKCRSILIKIIVADSLAVRDSIIKATNNQTEVQSYSLHATDKIQRDIEEILFKNELYYERKVNYYANQGYSMEKIYAPLYLASGFVNLVLKEPFKAVTLKSKFMNNPRQYEKVFSDETDLRIWINIAKIIRKTELVIERIKGKSSKFIKNMRQYVAFIAIARIFDKFYFSQQELIELDLQRYTDDIILDTVNYINDHWPHEQYRTKWSSYLFFLEVCKKCSDHYDIKGCNSLEKEKEILSDMELHNKEKIKEKEKKERNIRDKVAKSLPKQPWPKGIHKQIAQELGLKNWEVSNAINALIESGAVYYQKDGIVYDKQGREIKGANQEIN